MKNIFKTFLLMTALTLLFIWVGNMLGGRGGMMTMFIISILMNLGSYWFSDKIVLAMYKARDPLPAEQRIVSIVQNLTTQANIPMPKVKVIDTEVPNAFATGRNPKHAVVAATTGILRILNERELTAVLAHELTHVRNRDILIGAVAAAMAGALSMIARMALWFGPGSSDDRNNGLATLVLLIVAPIAAMLIQLAISRSREYAADRGAGILTNRPRDLVEALEKLHNSVSRNPLPQMAGAEATAHLFIVNPFKLSNFAAMFSTHPSLEQRAKKLMELEEELRGVPKGMK